MTNTELTPADARNALTLLNRVPVTGVQEAQVLALLAHKLKVIAQPPRDNDLVIDAYSASNSDANLRKDPEVDE